MARWKNVRWRALTEAGFDFRELSDLFVHFFPFSRHVSSNVYPCLCGVCFLEDCRPRRSPGHVSCSPPSTCYFHPNQRYKTVIFSPVISFFFYFLLSHIFYSHYVCTYSKKNNTIGALNETLKF